MGLQEWCSSNVGSGTTPILVPVGGQLGQPCSGPTVRSGLPKSPGCGSPPAPLPHFPTDHGELGSVEFAPGEVLPCEPSYPGGGGGSRSPTAWWRTQRVEGGC